MIYIAEYEIEKHVNAAFTLFICVPIIKEPTVTVNNPICQKRS